MRREVSALTRFSDLPGLAKRTIRICVLIFQIFTAARPKAPFGLNRTVSSAIFTPMLPPRRVALLIETSNAYARGILKGVATYVRQHASWSICLSESRRGDISLAWLADWEGDGVIARIENRTIAKYIKKLKVPAVDVSAARLIPSLPWVETDDAAIAQLVADHLLERGFKQFGFCGDDRFQWSRLRQKHFASVIRKRGLFCSVHRPFPARSGRQESENKSIEDWLVRLPKPVGIMACYDFRGRQILSACRQNNVAVPDEVAVIGADNDTVLCELADPPLSSVSLNAPRIGYDAAALLDRMMSGEKVNPTGHLINPVGVVTRQSTDVLAIDDPGVVAAVRYIRAHACDGISVKDVLKAVPQSRRSLETRFIKNIGRTPHDEITRVKLNRVRRLLVESDWSLERIAETAGFAHAGYLSTVFSQTIGVNPSAYRASNRPKTD